MNSHSTTRFGGIALGVAVSSLALAACSPQPTTEKAEAPAAEATAAAPAENAAVPAAPAAAAGVAPDNVDTVSGAKFASFTGDATKGEAVFAACKVCHAVEAGVNKIGPSLNAIVGRKAGEVAGYTYSAANKNSGITWSAEKMFQYLENPQRVVPGTKMTYPGLPDPQKRADVIAYLAAQK
ncbi:MULTISPECIES: cytochrome c family protein [unclassified Sphingomonas]|uniref:c-type cytochrome n=1 Tax=unclassified Sphingomonas TaxID=196159 RepID=UPI000BC9B2A4|nr:MAG: cytochrome c family protein [Sphingomonas sp. 12-62-6]OYX40306.1 MAG: cytochrome c family protein [Sphingomonas sp. 32-62-10]OYY65519.1 MAG: cytochrome c family protein [Sphingomonas sp. 28-62-11]